MYYIGIDTGGTFTDVVLMNEVGEVHVFKTPTTPGEPSQGVMDGLNLASEELGMGHKDLLKQTVYLGHGTTIATNAFLQSRGVKTGLITTKGFGDTLLMQRMMGPTAGMMERELMHYTARQHPDPPLVPPALIREVTERTDYKGEELVPLNQSEVRQAVRVAPVSEAWPLAPAVVIPGVPALGGGRFRTPKRSPPRHRRS